MSVVIGIQTDHFVVIASDSQATTSSGRVMSAGKLINAHSDLTVGLVGTLHWQKWVINQLSAAAPDPEEITDANVATPVGLDPERALEFRWLLDNIPESEGEDESCFALLASPRGIYLIDGAGVVPLVPSNYDGRLSKAVVISAVGSGADFALGAILTHLAVFDQLGRDIDDFAILENVIVNALATTYRFDPSCSGPPRIRSFDRRAPQKTLVRTPTHNTASNGPRDDDDADDFGPEDEN